MIYLTIAANKINAIKEAIEKFKTENEELTPEVQAFLAELQDILDNKLF